MFEMPRKCENSFRVLCGIFPDIPLLYRWKHWEAAGSYALRGIGVNGVLVDLLQIAYSKSLPDMEAIAATWDEDDADLQLSVKQDLRVSKTVLLLKDPATEVT